MGKFGDGASLGDYGSPESAHVWKERYKQYHKEIDAFDKAIGEADLDAAHRDVATKIVLDNLREVAHSAKPGKPGCILTEIDRRILARARGKVPPPANYTLQPEQRKWVKWTLRFLFNNRSDEIANGEGTPEAKRAAYLEAKREYRQTLGKHGLGKG